MPVPWFLGSLVPSKAERKGPREIRLAGVLVLGRWQRRSSVYLSLDDGVGGGSAAALRAGNRATRRSLMLVQATKSPGPAGGCEGSGSKGRLVDAQGRQAILKVLSIVARRRRFQRRVSCQRWTRCVAPERPGDDAVLAVTAVARRLRATDRSDSTFGWCHCSCSQGQGATVSGLVGPCWASPLTASRHCAAPSPL